MRDTCLCFNLLRATLARSFLLAHRDLPRDSPTSFQHKQASKAKHAYCTLLLQIDVVAKLGVELGLESVHALLDVLELALEGHEVLLDLLLSCAEAIT